MLNLTYMRTVKRFIYAGVRLKKVLYVHSTLTQPLFHYPNNLIRRNLT